MWSCSNQDAQAAVKNTVRPPVRTLQTAAVVSLLILLAGIWAVFRWWYPQAFWQASGVFKIASYALLVHLGITALLVLPWRNRMNGAEGVQTDAAFLVFVMSVAALFSLSFLFAGRPVALVFAVDRVALVRANEVRTTELAFPDTFAKELRRSGPLQLIAARPSSDEERLNSIQLAMAGFDLHQRPSFWVPIDVQQDQLRQKAKSFGELRALHVEQAAKLSELQANWAIFLPLEGTHGNWVLVLDEDLKAYAPHKID